MRIEDLEVFIATAESEMFFTPSGDPHRYYSSASKEILRLEEEFSTTLFLREGQNTGILTEAGELLLQQAKPLVKMYRRTMRSMDRFRSKDDCALIIGTMPVLKQYRLNRLFNRFKDDHDDINFEIEETDDANLISGLKDDYYDAVVVRKNMIHDRNIEMFKLASDEMAAILWKDHPLANQPSIQLPQLKNEEFYLANPYTSSYGLCWKLLKDYHISTENVHTANVSEILPVVAEKKGVAILPVSNLNASPVEGITAIPLHPRVTMEVVFAVKKNKERSAMLEDLIEVIRIRSRAIPQ